MHSRNSIEKTESNLKAVLGCCCIQTVKTKQYKINIFKEIFLQVVECSLEKHSAERW